MGTIAQSICNHYSSLSGQPDIFLGSGTLKKGPIYGLQKSRAQKTGPLLKKIEKRPGCLLSFWVTMTLFFASCFLQCIFWTFFSESQTDPCFQNKNSGYRLTGRISFADSQQAPIFLVIMQGPVSCKLWRVSGNKNPYDYQFWPWKTWQKIKRLTQEGVCVSEEKEVSGSDCGQ